MPESFYLIDTLVLLAAAVVAVPLFQLLRLGSVLGFLAAGALVGPWGLGFIDQVEEIRHLAEFGVVFLLFIIGIELKPSRLWIMRRSVFGLGSAQVLVTGLIISGLGLAFGIPERAALIVGFGLALSSTAFGLQILAEKGDLRSAYGRSAFAILLLQDLAVVPLIALVPLLAQRGVSLTQHVELAALETLAILLGVLVLGRLLTRPMLDLVASRRTPELFVAAAVMLVLGTAWLTERAGLSMALGAFLAGILLSDSRYRHQIMADIQPFRGMLLGLFFMTVGMGIDFGLLGQQGPQVLGLVAGLLAIKAGLLWALCRASGRDHGEAIHVALLLPQGGEFGFVLFGLAAGLGVFSDNLYQLLVLVVAMSMAFTPLLVKLSPWLGRLPDHPAAPDAVPPEPVPEASGHVIIAGFGRFGQRLAGILAKAGISYRALDINPARIAEARARGLSVYYGDAGRIDVLRAAGAANSALVVFTLDNMEISARGVAALHEAYPELPIYARASDFRAGQRLRAMGASHAIPETLEASLQLAAEVLRAAKLPGEVAAHLLEENRRKEYAKLATVNASPRGWHFKDILLVVTPQAGQAELLEHIGSLAHEHQARLTVAEVVEAAPGETQRDRAVDPRQQRLAELIGPWRDRIEVEAALLAGKTATPIIREVVQGERDLVVKVADHVGRPAGRSVRDRDLQLLRECPCPIWLVKPGAARPYRRILAAVDVDYHGPMQAKPKHARNRQVLEYAVALALFDFAELHVVHVWQAYGEEALRSGRSPFPQWDTDAYVAREEKKHLDSLHDLLAEVRGSVGSDTLEGLKPRTHLVSGEPRDELARLARSLQVDLVVMGSSAHRGISGLIIGNTAESLLTSLDCSMFVIKSADFVTSMVFEE